MATNDVLIPGAGTHHGFRSGRDAVAASWPARTRAADPDGLLTALYLELAW
ncbi:hypothetical protein [Pseudonocardia sp. H11422]|uniref:hypothetical protein n=1 Tax=Pseudonocardia sp. H11422 TaxID=2835866 RepID=UPI001BDD8A29|nr:hypothetical protein [Pseudonocardia sp. H11422]